MLPENPSGAPDIKARNYRLAALAALLLTVGFAGGVFFGELRAKPDSAGQAGSAATAGTGKVSGLDSPAPIALKDVDFAHFWEVWKMVKEKHAGDPASDVKMYYGAISGMVASLGDPYSVFFDPEFAQKFARELEGSFDGIGAEIGVKKDMLTIIAPLPGTPADKAGLKAGDRIFAIDGEDTSGMAVEDAVSRIRGQQGTSVKLLIGRDGVRDPKEYTIVRATITVDSVKSKTVKGKDGKTYIQITISQFNDNTQPKFNEAVRAALAADPAGIVLDLRNDPGGYLDTAIAVASEWIPDGTIVSERSADGTEKKYPAQGTARLADMPTVVLINGGSASASEIVAGALQDTRKGVLVGEKSFGKGSVQDYTEFDDGSALKLTIAKWFTPKGRSIDKEGITPDIEVKLTPADFEADKDPQLDKAIELLSAPGGLPKTFPKPDTTAEKKGDTL